MGVDTTETWNRVVDVHEKKRSGVWNRRVIFSVLNNEDVDVIAAKSCCPLFHLEQDQRIADSSGEIVVNTHFTSVCHQNWFILHDRWTKQRTSASSNKEMDMYLTRNFLILVRSVLLDETSHPFANCDRLMEYWSVIKIQDWKWWRVGTGNWWN